MLLPAYDAHGRLYYPQYEDAPPRPDPPIRARRATTRTVCACIDDTLYTFQRQQQEKQRQSFMVVRQPRSAFFATSSIAPTSVLGPIPKWTGGSEGGKRGRSRKSSVRDFERSRSRDIPGAIASKSREMEISAQYHGSNETFVSVVEAECTTPMPSLDPTTASDYSAFTDIVTPGSTHGHESRPPSIVPSSFKTVKQFFSSANTSTASLLSQTAPSPKKKFCRTALFPPVGEEEYPARGLCPSLQVLLMSSETQSTRQVNQQNRSSRPGKVRDIREARTRAFSPPLEVSEDQDPLVIEIRSALDNVISLEIRKDTSDIALPHRIASDFAAQRNARRMEHFTSYFSFVTSPSFKTFTQQSASTAQGECSCCISSNAWVQLSGIDLWIDVPTSPRELRPPARRRADGTTLRKWCLEWQMVVHGKVDCIKHRNESKPPVFRQKQKCKRGKERWGCGCVDHGFD
ncbi:hypothetical protein NliqN6_0301 [Naganishia liquefaciens]|uniref:Uncharacterized protein n=1 Tax=Naganishia liquefaciens TaxID=104408 RepID=A0A8H3TPD8_9TREE|nr:hypothetical protein NliqN6_0301 [Naganishia liquefaciens]